MADWEQIDAGADRAEYDKVAQASLNSLYVKAQELDRGHNENDAPAVLPPGATSASGAVSADVVSHASTHASDAHDAETHVSTHASDARDVQAHASTHASDG